MNDYPGAPERVCRALRRGLVIPAHPLALDENRRLDERRQRALSRYYHAAGAGGLAVGVHTTQFAIRDPNHGLLRPVLELASETVREADAATGRFTVMIAGVCGATDQATGEARLAVALGYHAGLLSLSSFRDAPESSVLDHCRAVAHEIPLVGFYLQPAVGGRHLSAAFWREFAAIPNVVAIKIAPFDRYRTLDVVRGVVESGQEDRIALYTGNDDNIVVDLLTEYAILRGEEEVRTRIVGGLLGHWACWTRSAVDLLERCRAARDSGLVPAGLLTLAAAVTDANAAFFDAANGFAGCIAGIHEVLRRQGLMESIRCLDPDEGLSPGQLAEIDRVYASYPDLADDAFVGANLDQWLR